MSPSRCRSLPVLWRVSHSLGGWSASPLESVSVSLGTLTVSARHGAMSYLSCQSERNRRRIAPRMWLARCGNAHMGQNEKTAIVNYQPEPLTTPLRAPADEGVTGLNFPGRAPAPSPLELIGEQTLPTLRASLFWKSAKNSRPPRKGAKHIGSATTERDRSATLPEATSPLYARRVH